MKSDQHVGFTRAIIKSRLSFLFLTSILFVGCSQSHPTEQPQADQTTTSNVGSTSDVVKVKMAVTSIPAGGSGEAGVGLSILPGFHVNANPATFDYLIATQLNATQTEGISPGKPVYPTAEKKSFQFAKEPLSVYEGEVQIKLPLTVDTNAAKGSHSLPIKVRVQACDTEKCYPPDTLSAVLAIEVK
jgi:DsbC/DsbD-like thiol-disulfide interchange protein